jgi:hypothetical protein
MNRQARLRTSGPLALGAKRAAASLGARVRRAHQTVCGHLPIQLRWRRAARAGSVVHAFTRQIISVIWAPRITLHFGVAPSDRRPSMAPVVQPGGSTTHQHVQRMWTDVRTTGPWRPTAHETSGGRRERSRPTSFPAVERRADAFGRGVAALSRRHARAAFARRALMVPVARRSAKSTLTDRVVERQADVFRPSVASSIRRARAVAMYGPLAASVARGSAERTLTVRVVQRHADVFRTTVALSIRRTMTVAVQRLLTAPVARRVTETPLTDRFADPMLHSERRAPRRSLAGAGRRSLLGRDDDRHSHRTGLTDGAQRVTHRPIELTWQRSTPPASGHTPSTPVEATFAGAPFPGRSSFTQPASAGVVTSVPATNPARPFNLDASQLDRLTDDVIRRVERRVRIARERRGL